MLRKTKNKKKPHRETHCRSHNTLKGRKRVQQRERVRETQKMLSHSRGLLFAANGTLGGDAAKAVYSNGNLSAGDISEVIA